MVPRSNAVVAEKLQRRVTPDALAGHIHTDTYAKEVLVAKTVVSQVSLDLDQGLLQRCASVMKMTNG